MGKYTQLERNYWRYLIMRKGRKFARSHFHEVLNKAEGKRKDELIKIYKSVGFGRVGGE
jgi:hypothetical protein